MARQASASVANNFGKGLITTASGLNFPEQAVTETFDCIFNLNGTVSRREGFDFEQNYSTKAIVSDQKDIVQYLWRDVAGDGSIYLLVVQIGSKLYFYDVSSNDPISGHALATTVDLTTFSPATAPAPDTAVCQFAAGNGLLFVVHPWLESFYCTYDTNTHTISTTQITLQFRDFTGVTDTYNFDNRPTVGMGGVSLQHHYNLLNQGWNDTNLNTWDAARTDLPSNCDVMWSFKNASNVFDTTTVANVVNGNSPAPKGHFILNVYNQDRTAASGITTAAVTTSYQRSSAVCFFAGRVFYSGINYVGYNSNIYFTQIVERPDQYNQCYQSNDPTSETLFDLLPSDGGVIVNQDFGTVVKMIPASGGLLIFCTNGIWQLAGSTGLGFTANDYSLTKISSIRALTASSFVDVTGTVMFWNLEGIYAVAPTQVGGTPSVQSITDGTIREFMYDIPPSSKRHAKGYYNSITGVIQWLYKSTDSGTINELFRYDRVLNFNVFTKCFYPWTINQTSPSHVYVHDLVVLENLGGTVSTDTVIDGAAETVIDQAGDTVVVYTINDGIVIPKFKYLVTYTDGSSVNQVTFAETLDDTNWKDWATINTAQDYTSYFISGYIIRGQAQEKFQPTWVYVYADTTTATSYTFQGLWDYALNSNSKRESSISTLSLSDTDFKNGIRRIKVRGSGKILQFKVSSVTGSPYTLVGWSSFETKNAIP